MSQTVGVVVPVLNESARLPDLLTELRACQPGQVIVVDGGSSDGCWQWLRQESARTPWLQALRSEPGRARQMNAGAAKATTSILLFLHADTTLAPPALESLRRLDDQYGWGRFTVRFDHDSVAMRMVARWMNWRSTLTGVCTGDQGIFVRQSLFKEIGGFPDIPLMEDIALCKRLKGISRPHRIATPIITSARRWEQHGWVRTVIKMWALRLLYWLGVSPATLATRYPRTR